jgi:hypothetical protein
MTGDSGPKGNREESGLNAESFRRMTGRMIEALSDPRYVEAVRAVRAAPDEARLVEATRRLSPDGLREQGVPIPPGMRISSRYFEPGFPDVVELGDPPAGRINMVNALNEVAPGLLDRLRMNHPEIYRQLAAPGPGLDLGPEPRVKHCACGGHTFGSAVPTTVCGGAGVDLPI